MEKEVVDVFPKLQNVLFGVKSEDNVKCKRNLRERSIYFYIFIILVLATNYDHFAYTESLSGGKRVASIHNLTGKYIIMGIGDTGLDVTQCMFHDDNQLIFYNSVNYNHRKVISYVTLQNDKEDTKYIYIYIYLFYSAGHGTHVCGIAAGASSISNAPYNSLAKDSKIDFWDLSTNGEIISAPSDIENSYFEKMVSKGDTLSSNSWGALVSYYSDDTYRIDRYMYI